MSRNSFMALAGSGLSLFGLYLATVSGLLFGEYVCFAGLACDPVYRSLRFELWMGMTLFVVGLGLLTLSIFRIAKKLRTRNSFG